MSKVDGYYIGAPVEGLTKQWAIWATTEPNICWPLVYLQKPKGIGKERWAEICNSITINLPKGFEP